MSWNEIPRVFESEGCRLVGIVAAPAKPIAVGVVIIVGGPQYRAGSHRQFTLLARHLAEQGIASIRFDYRGMGDSEGDFRNFEYIQADIRAAIACLSQQVTTICNIALWGLCDAASAALYYGHTDPRVSPLILLNPWVHHEALAAKARLKHYYLTRLLQRSFWSKLLSGGVGLRKSLGSLSQSVRAASTNVSSKSDTATPADPRHGSQGYIQRMLQGLQAFRGEVLFILSGNDLVAQEFMALLRQDAQWRNACAAPTITRKTLDAANHTFSSQVWRDQVSEWTASLIHSDSYLEQIKS